MKTIGKRMFEACCKGDMALLSSACIVDYGMSEQLNKVFGAFRDAIHQGCTVEEIEKVRGKSGAIQKLLHKYGQAHITIQPTAQDIIAIPSYNKITVGFVVQKYVRNAEGDYVCTEQDFTCGDEISYENEDGEDVSHALDPADELYQSYLMEQP